MNDEILEEAKVIAREIISLCFDISYEPLNETAGAIEIDIRKAKNIGSIKNAIDEITIILGEVDSNDPDETDIINQINELLTRLDEEFL
jgi:ABC-type enterochelin transport system substrate-binding protein